MKVETLNGQVALVTGGGRGIGATVARKLAEAGAKVALFSRSQDQIDEVAREIGGGAIAVPVDVSDYGAVCKAVKAVEAEFGGIDLLVNNAGVTGTSKRIVDIDPADWWRTQEINVLGVLHVTKAVLPGMIERKRGRIVHMGSLAGNEPGPGATDYSVSKTALLRLNESIASEISELGLLSIAVSPGIVRTAMVEHFENAFRKDREGWQGFPEDRIYPPEAVGDLIVRIAKGEADELGGTFIHVRESLDDLRSRHQEIQDNNLLKLRLLGA